MYDPNTPGNRPNTLPNGQVQGSMPLTREQMQANMQKTQFNFNSQPSDWNASQRRQYNSQPGLRDKYNVHQRSLGQAFQQGQTQERDKWSPPSNTGPVQPNPTTDVMPYNGNQNVFSNLLGMQPREDTGGMVSPMVVPEGAIGGNPNNPIYGAGGPGTDANGNPLPQYNSTLPDLGGGYGGGNPYMGQYNQRWQQVQDWARSQQNAMLSRGVPQEQINQYINHSPQYRQMRAYGNHINQQMHGGGGGTYGGAGYGPNPYGTAGYGGSMHGRGQQGYQSNPYANMASSIYGNPNLSAQQQNQAWQQAKGTMSQQWGNPYQQFNQRGYPTASRANLTQGQQSNFMQRLYGGMRGNPSPTTPTQYGSSYGGQGYQNMYSG